jgi:membrane protein
LPDRLIELAARLRRAALARAERHSPRLLQAGRLIIAHEVVDRAAALAMFAMMAAVPALFGMLSVLGYVLGFLGQIADVIGVDIPAGATAEQQLLDWIRNAMPGVAWDPTELAQALKRHRAANAIVGVLGGLFVGTTVFTRVDAGIRALCGLPKRSLLGATGLLSVLTLVGAGAAMLLPLLAPLLNWVLQLVAASISSLSLGAINGLLLIWVLGELAPITIAFVVIVRYSAGKQSSPRLWLVGVGYAAVWFVGSRAFGWYVSEFMRIDAVYGALAGVVALMLWLYYAALGFFAAVAVLAAPASRDDDTAAEPNPEVPDAQRDPQAAPSQ